MSYEKEAIPDSKAALPQQPQAPITREERVFEPYKVKTVKAAAPAQEPAPVGQVDNTRESPLEEPKPNEETVKLSPQVAALARKEQRFRQQQLALEKERAAIAQEKAELAQLRAMKEKLAAKDYSGLDDLVDYNEYSQYQVNKLNGTDSTQEALKKIEGKIADIEKNTQENLEKQFEAAVNERRVAVKDLVATSQEFPRIKKAKAEEAVVQHILDTWEHDSKELSVKEAAKEVEELLLERAKKWSGLIEEEKQEAQPEDKKQLPPMKPALKTLTNQITAGDLKRSTKSLHHMSDAERWAEARRRAEEKLQQGQR